MTLTRTLIAVTATAMAIGVAGCASPPDDPSGTSQAAPTPSMTSMPSLPAQPRAIAHIHALEMNPADQTLYAATHHGMFQLTGGEPPRHVGDSTHDFMGFTVAGPDHFLASGHPGAADAGQPSDLGLIESTDGGKSWNSLSLSGRADFHALEYRHGRAYGRDSHTGRILISQDMTTWQSRPPVDAVDLVVSPDDPDELLVTTAAGLARSRDAGETYVRVEGAPDLVYLSWPETGPLIGVDAAGLLYASGDAGQTWQARAGVAQRPHAVLAVGDGRVFLATDTAIYHSTDHATTVTELTDLH